MPKQQFLSRDDKGWKLRRRVPAKLQGLAGKTQWVKRLSGVNFKEACERANVFGVRTDAEIKRLTKALKLLPIVGQPLQSLEPGFTFDLTDHEIDQIAVSYFHELEQKLQKSGGYRRGVTSDNRSDVIIDLAQDYGRADAIAVGDDDPTFSYPNEDISAVFHYTALKLLINCNFLDRSSFEEKVEGRRRRKGQIITRLRLTADLKENPQFQKLSDKLAEASAEMARRRLEAITENRHPTLQNPLFKPALDPAPLTAPQREVRLGELVKSYLQKRKKEVGVSRYDQLLIATRALVEEVGKGVPLTHITREQCQSIADLFVDVPAYVSRHYKGLSLREAADAYEKKNGVRPQRYSEAVKHLSVLREVFEHAVDKGWVPNNPVQRVKIYQPARPNSYAALDEGYEPFELEELKVIFSQPLYGGCQNDENGINRKGPNHPRRSRFWLPLISLYSGLRMQEILQLERSDIRCDFDVHYFSVNDRIEGHDYAAGEYVKQLKARNSLRSVPVHPELVRLGFLNFAASCERDWLFPDVPCLSAGKMSNQFSKKFKTFLKPTGVWVPRRKVFHSFRGTFNDALRAADVSVEFREAIMGWVDCKKMDARYGKGHLIKRLHAVVSNVSYPGLDLSHLYPR